MLLFLVIVIAVIVHTSIAVGAVDIIDVLDVVIVVDVASIIVNYSRACY